MKLSSQYTPSAHKIPNNELYMYFQDVFIDSLREPEDRDPIKETISREKYIYKISESEKEFYEQIFVEQGKRKEIKKVPFLREIFKEGYKDGYIGEYISDILTFIKLKSNLALVLAPIGFGKTVLLKYVWFYLINKIEWLKTHTIPIYISVDHHKRLFSHEQGEAVFRNQFVNKVLYERLIDVVSDFTDLEDEEFWNFLKTGSDMFNSLEQEEKDKRFLFSDPQKLKKEIYAARSAARQKSEFPYVALKFIRSCCGKIPIVIFDNVDTTSIDVNQVLLDEALSMSRDYNIKVLISMRENTFGKLYEKRDGNPRAFPPLRVHMRNSSVDDYIESRMRLIERKIANTQLGYEYNNPVGDIRVTFKDATKLYKLMLDMLLNEESKRVMAHVSNFNLRKINTFLLDYLSTGYINEHHRMEKIISSIKADEKIVGSPLWILLSSIITNNYKTRFSTEYLPFQKDIINLYCNGNSKKTGSAIRIHILNYLKRNAETPLQRLKSTYMDVFNIKEEDFLYAVWRLHSCDLIDSPESYKIEAFENIDQIKTMNITETGKYYRLEFRNYFEYLVYMKDDTFLGKNPYDIRDSIKVTSLEGRYVEVRKFLKMIFYNGKKLLSNLETEKRRMYAESFSMPEDGSIICVRNTVKGMIDFGFNRREYLGDEIVGYQELLDEINEFEESFIDSIS